jgi:hypothetical protein
VGSVIGRYRLLQLIGEGGFGAALNCTGEEAEPAELCLRRVTCMRQRGMTADDPVLLGALSDSLRFLDRAGRAAEGESFAREISSSLSRLGGGHDTMAGEYDAWMAHFVSMQGRLDEADALFQSLLPREPATTHDVARARLHLFFGVHLVRRGNFEQAERELDTAAALAEDVRLGTLPSHPDDIILGYIALYEASGQRERVAEYQRLRQEALARRQGTFASSEVPASLPSDSP